jgi:hypothetical protein
VRRVAHGVGVERVFPYFSPLIDKVEVTRVGKVRRSRLYYLRERVGKAARIKPGSRARFEALTNKPYVEPTVEEEEAELEAEAIDEQEGAEIVAAEEVEELMKKPSGGKAPAAGKLRKLSWKRQRPERRRSKRRSRRSPARAGEATGFCGFRCDHAASGGVFILPRRLTPQPDPRRFGAVC